MIKTIYIHFDNMIQLFCKTNLRFALKEPKVRSTTKKPLTSIRNEGLVIKWQRPTLPRVTAVPSALLSLTALFGMVRGDPQRYRHHIVFNTLIDF